MDSSGSAASIVSALARTHQRLGYLAWELRTRDGVVSVASLVAPQRYNTGDRVECYADAELVSGNALGWWLEFRYEAGSWIIESSVRSNTELGQYELIGLPVRYAVSDAELVCELGDAVDMLVATADRLNFEKL
jgi:hypothetical protein